MIPLLRAAIATLATLLVLTGIGWASRAPYDAPGASAALLRLSWRMPVPDARVCRARTPAELEALPAHMRTPDVCENVSLRYRLEIAVDDRPARVVSLHTAGARGDRPLFVLDETTLAPGRHRVRVRLTPAGARERELLRFDGEVEAVPGGILLLTLDEASGGLVLRRSGSPSSVSSHSADAVR